VRKVRKVWKALLPASAPESGLRSKVEGLRTKIPPAQPKGGPLWCGLPACLTAEKRKTKKPGSVCRTRPSAMRRRLDCELRVASSRSVAVREGRCWSAWSDLGRPEFVNPQLAMGGRTGRGAGFQPAQLSIADCEFWPAEMGGGEKERRSRGEREMILGAPLPLSLFSVAVPCPCRCGCSLPLRSSRCR
jgi:hypothetical protein